MLYLSIVISYNPLVPQKIWTQIPKISVNQNDFYTNAVKFFLSLKNIPVFKMIKEHIYGNSILDIGVGIGGIFCELKKNNFNVTGIDVKNLSIVKEATPIIYNGTDIPFEDGKFDTSLLIYVLHHCGDPNKVLDEAKRVSKRVIIMEDTYRDSLEKTIISVNDMIGNSEFFEHQYRTVDQWKEHIKNRGWKLIAEKEFSDFMYGLYGRHYLMVIE